VLAQLSSLESAKVIDPAFSDRLAGLAKDAAGVQGLEALLRRSDAGGIKAGGNAINGVRSLDAIRAEMKDPRYDSLNRQFDRKFRERVDTEYMQAKARG
jgi:hypothetical protein